MEILDYHRRHWYGGRPIRARPRMQVTALFLSTWTNTITVQLWLPLALYLCSRARQDVNQPSKPQTPIRYSAVFPRTIIYSRDVLSFQRWDIDIDIESRARVMTTGVSNLATCRKTENFKNIVAETRTDTGEQQLTSTWRKQKWYWKTAQICMDFGEWHQNWRTAMP